MRPLVLASTSPYRQSLLRQIGLPFEAHPSGFDEAPYKGLGLPPADLARLLAEKKAEALASRFPEALLLGSDQVAEIGGVILSKPGEEATAQAQLRRLSGQTHHLWTATAIHDPQTKQTLSGVDLHRLTMRPLTEGQIRSYIRHDRPLDCAGSFRIEGQGIALFSAIEGNDYTAIIGMSLLRVVELLAHFGIKVPSEEA